MIYQVIKPCWVFQCFLHFPLIQKFYTEERARLMFASCPCPSKLQLAEKTWHWGIRGPTEFLPLPHPASGAANSPRVFGAPVPSKPVFPGPHRAGDTENPDSPLQGILLSHSCSSYQLLSASCGRFIMQHLSGILPLQQIIVRRLETLVPHQQGNTLITQLVNNFYCKHKTTTELQEEKRKWPALSLPAVLTHHLLTPTLQQ